MYVKTNLAAHNSFFIESAQNFTHMLSMCLSEHSWWSVLHFTCRGLHKSKKFISHEHQFKRNLVFTVLSHDLVDAQNLQWFITAGMAYYNKFKCLDISHSDLDLGEKQSRVSPRTAIYLTIYPYIHIHNSVMTIFFLFSFLKILSQTLTFL